jgi:uncharacterized membrane protein YhaH (DUF805 family)
MMELLRSFDPRRRRGRQAYLAFHLALLVLMAMTLFLLVFVLPDFLGLSPDSWAINIAGLLSSIVTSLLCLAVLSQRCHDIGWPGWCAFLIFVPMLGTVFWLALFFISGTRGPNKYGSDPRAEPASI